MTIKPYEQKYLAQLSREELQALDYFASKNGGRWKTKLRDFWMFGGLENETNGDALQRVRNKIGSAGLQSIRRQAIATAVIIAIE
jgi:hypothetical protein